MMFQRRANVSVQNLDGKIHLGATCSDQGRMHKNLPRTFLLSFRLEDVISISRKEKATTKVKGGSMIFLRVVRCCFHR